MEEPLQYEAITGLTAGQLAELAARVTAIAGGVADRRVLSAEGGRYRLPISKYQEMLQAVIGLIFFTAYK